MRSDILLRTMADAYGWDYDELYFLKYELDQHYYYYGQHFKEPRECAARRISPDQFFSNAAEIKKYAALFAQAPGWAIPASPQDVPTVVGHNYNYADWLGTLERAGYRLEPPIWYLFPTDNPFQQALQAVSSFLAQMVWADFNLLLSKEMRDCTRIVKQLFIEYYSHPRFRAAMLPHAVGLFDRLLIHAFRMHGRPTFVFDHGIPSAIVYEFAKFPDYTVVWGETTKKSYIEGGLDAERIIVTGHPTYHDYTPAPLRFDTSDVLIITWSLCGAPFGDGPLFQNRAHAVYFFTVIETALKRLGVRRARIRPHPSEAVEWFERFIDPAFYTIDREPLAESLKKSSLVIGGASTVFIEALYYGVNYLIFQPALMEINRIYYKEVPPFDGSDPRAPVAHTPEELEEFIRSKRGFDPSCFSDCISIPFRPERILEKITSHVPDAAAIGTPSLRASIA